MFKNLSAKQIAVFEEMLSQPFLRDLAERAFDGSLDAAAALHSEIISQWSVDDFSENGMQAGHPWGIRLQKWDASKGGAVMSVSAGWGDDVVLPSRNPARVWLGGIFRAYATERGAYSE